ncbi:MAG TPA: NAD-dependent epimerase/dehydratase family protein [Phenylobacterium sp.]|jgi:nucleoside-diphosphate-sugar epimerase|uniref:NAD-dependent epimerase/dehydratase family protein n=1 Tax=Phenylobacterium sp. TaxID=1871053 RepID=UPI002D3F3B17|nr:NAD-dependent epimerase/dehydratase family protein [Phenylobacterium sp.]HZZ70398.1 NAD-dependent epimerase/dehydratase family protein [Phenylobacterium sp.]
MISNNNDRLALVVGATGGVGGAVADRLLAGGWRVRALNRDPETARRTSGRAGLEWVKGDAMIEAQVVAVAKGASLVVHGANPAGYRNWAGLQMPMLNSAIAAAKAAGARLVFPGTVYNYGPDAFPNLTEDRPQHPVTRKGAIRVQMEDALKAASDDGLKVLIVRAGDFFGPKSTTNSWMASGLVKPGRPLTSVMYPGPLAIAHSWAYLPDVAEAMVTLAERNDLGAFEIFHMAGHTVTGEALVAAFSRVAGRKVNVSRLPWFAIHAIAPFNETMREMLEMRYLWETPVLLENAKLTARLGAEPHTPIDEALRETLTGLNALPVAAPRLAA